MAGLHVKAISLATAKEITADSASMPIRMLLLEESPGNAQCILEELHSAGMTVESTVARSCREFLDAIARQSFSLIVSAYRLRDWTAFEALQALQEAGKQAPFIVISDELGEAARAECLRHGVTDCVLKSQLVRLPAAVRRGLEEAQLRQTNRETRRALAESEIRNHELIENSVYGICRVALDGAFVSANPALLQMLACPALEALQTMHFLKEVFRFPEHCVKAVTSCRKDGLVHCADTEWRRKDGGLLAIKLHLRYVTVPGAADQMEAIVEDVTELRSLEHQLLQAQKFETIGQLAGGMAHDFNNVVGAILAWAELGYEEGLAFPRIAERFARIREQAGRAASLTRELLAFARCQELQPRPVDLNTIVQSLATFLDKVIGKDIEMKVIPGVLQAIQADPAQIEQVLMNLCLNARDAMPEGGRLAIETQMERIDDGFCRFYPYATPGRYAVLAVSDTGIGMTPEIRERIFEPFFTTKERGSGTGMGLATAYGIAKQHGGFIQVYSEPWQGTLFRVYLPACDDGGLVPPPNSSSSEFSIPGSLDGSETILLAEDYDAVREMVRQWLVSLGYKVLAAANGEEATRLCAEEAPALAILDVVMPRLGGTATATKLRSRFPGLPVLFTSGYSEATGVAASRLENSYYIQKPYSPTSLGHAVRRILDSPAPDAKAEIQPHAPD